MKCIRRVPRGWQTYVQIRGRFYSKRWKPNTPLITMKRWIEEKRVRIRLGHSLPPPASTLAEDIQHYLTQVRTMPTIKMRKSDLTLWLDVFGQDRDRSTITSGEIRAELERWKAEGYAASTVNHRRTALMHLWSVLDGKSAPNPARDVPRYESDDADGPARGVPLIVCATILTHMRRSQTKARLLVMTYTGWPQMTLERLEPSDIRWGEQVYMKRRRKGRGVKGEWLPLVPAAWRALEEFKKQGCWGTFSRDSMKRSFRVAVGRTLTDDQVSDEIKSLIRPDIRPYDLRHAFGTMAALVTKDDTAVQKLMRHSDPRQTALYMKAAADPRVVAAIAKVAAALNIFPNHATDMPRRASKRKEAMNARVH